ncbi:discoidin domain-containing protein [Luteimonas sp. SJ-92]|uniref:Discoidin domain-containing protein n=1 Tax=Luteimonas salinisoli TaxID=2752307 RepID=A0A853JGB7_9GAMM|nr:discoidin domain-containing protein [Luteimonas salinisoli]NZA28441.1 discoidin domain-containing protein [Luteimonas salinisoli]
MTATAAADAGDTQVLDDFEDASPWRVVTSNQVSGSIREVRGEDGGALCLDYDYNGVSGHVGIQRDVAIDYPRNYQFGFRLRGESPANDLQFKLIDASGDNVWWVNRPRYDFPAGWTGVRYRRRHIDKAWGPDPEPELRASARVEFTIYNNAGGSGSVCFDELTLTPLPADDGAPLLPVRVRSDGEAGEPQAAVDGSSETAWRVPAGPQRLELDLGRPREFDGLRLEWAGGAHASRYVVALSDDGRRWREARSVEEGNGGVDWVALPESEARHVALALVEGPGPEYALAGLQLQPIGFATHPNDFIETIAGEARRGHFPRGFSGEQPYWTILGVDGGSDQGLIGEDGAVEVARGGFSIEPFVRIDDRLVAWADVEATRSLQDDYLPIPSVHWEHPDLRLEVTAFAHGDRDDARLVARYRLENTGARAREFILALAIRPFQVNPPSQFLNTIGGVSRIDSIAVGGRTVAVNGRERVHLSQAPDAAFATAFDAGMAVDHLADGAPVTREAVDADGLASGALLYRMRLAPGQSREIDLRVPLGEGTPALATGAADLQAAVAADWRDQLDRVRIEVPEAGQAVVDTLRTSLAHMLVSRIGPRLQPGTRSYSRSWIRDGAMISEGLLRMGREDVVKEYVEWYAPYQFRDGMVPCCVDDRGSDPVPENDSHGELIFNIAEYWRYTGDDAFLERMWPHVAGAFGYMEKLRASERTEANRGINPAFYGMMPASISHEGYSAKPMHSYWDNFWALRGYKDAVEVAEALGHDDQARRMAAARDEFRGDLYASLEAAARLHGIDYLPGAAELGDFDPTSTTIALAPGGEQGRLPPELVRNTFERYWREFVQRRDGGREWKDYTPYEWRNVAAFVRLGWRGRAWEALEYFFDDRAPRAWNQWGEVVSRTPRKPFFLGDLPHAWVGSDFVRSALDMFAYVREVDDSLVLAAGIPADWLEEGIAIHGLRTPQGTLGYALRREGGELRLDVDADADLPPGGLVLPWPLAGEPGPATVNGSAAAWGDHGLRIREAPARVRIAIP